MALKVDTHSIGYYFYTCTTLSFRDKRLFRFFLYKSCTVSVKRAPAHADASAAGGGTGGGGGTVACAADVAASAAVAAPGAVVVRRGDSLKEAPPPQRNRMHRPSLPGPGLFWANGSNGSGGKPSSAFMRQSRSSSSLGKEGCLLPVR